MPDDAAPTATSLPDTRLTATSADLWAQLGGDPDALDRLRFTGPRHVLASAFDVTGFAAATVGLATLAVAEMARARSTGTRSGDAGSSRARWDGPPAAWRPLVAVDRVHAAAAFLSEALFAPRGWERPAAWDPIAGDYQTADGWARLHTNYAAHRAAVLAVLDVPADRERVAAAARSWEGDALEAAVVAEGGCAAAMRTMAEWAAHPHGQVAVTAPAVRREAAGEVAGEAAGEFAGATGVAGGGHRGAPGRPGTRGPLAGVRVLDLTRVLAGPGCTRFLAAHGADVLRLDPPGFEEVPAIVPDVTIGKRCAWLDVSTPPGLEDLGGLVSQADVVVHGLRPGALEGLGVTEAWLRAHNPALVTATLDAYGWDGPWQARRGFDSLVQMSAGIAAAGAAARGVEQPNPLPAQALDHGTGYLLAAGVCLALAHRCEGGPGAAVRASLVGAANALVNGPEGDLGTPAPAWPDEVFEDVGTAWGPARRVRCPGSIDGVRPTWARPAGPLGAAEPVFT